MQYYSYDYYYKQVPLIEAEGGDSSECRHEERHLRAQA